MNKYLQTFCLNNYQMPGNDLQYCLNDGRGLSKALEPLGFQNDYMFDHFATKSNILDRLNYLALNSKAGDVYINAFSGHGTQVPNQNPGTDIEPDGLDECIVAWDHDWDKPETWLRDDYIYDVILKFHPQAFVYLIFDNCTSQSMFKGGMVNPALKRSIRYLHNPRLHGMDKAILQSRPPKNRALPDNVCVFSGCKDGKTSAEQIVNGLGGGLLHFSIIDTLNSKKRVANVDAIVRMKKYVGKYNPDQEPVLNCQSTMAGRKFLEVG